MLTMREQSNIRFTSQGDETMPVEFALWRLDGSPTKLEASKLPTELQLENLLAGDISVLGLDVMVVGRQVVTAYGKKVDLLAIDRDGSLHVIELKRDKTPREVVAQALDYGSWVKSLTYDQIAATCSQYAGGAQLEAHFFERFGTQVPEALNQEHHLVIVAAELDASTERIVTYLSADYGVPINVLFFRYFVDDGRSYLARTWLIEPSVAEIQTKSGGKAGKEPWNGSDFYVSFGDGPRRNWEDAREYGFISGGGGKWYSQTLALLQPGHRVFVSIPSKGYVGVGEVLAPWVPVTDFTVEANGVETPILDAPLRAPLMGDHAADPELSEHLVRVKWLKALPEAKAVWEPGMFANQHTACALRSSFTRERVLARFGLDT